MGGEERLRRIPPVDRVLQREAQAALLARYPHELVVQAVREALAAVGDDVRRAPADAVEDLLANEAVDARIAAGFEAKLAPRLVPVLNATGVVIHTNLGRSPLGDKTLAAVARAARGYSNLEYDLDAGRRGSRHSHTEDLFRDLTGAEAAMVVNNNAAAVLLILSALAAGREVVVSRGELIEIGGSFRLPEIMAAGGARLREVGATNRTRAADYEAAVGPDTAMLLKAHRSNFAIVGFTESPSLAELVEVGRRHGVPVVYDLGSGSVMELERLSLGEAVWAGLPLREGVDLVCFSGDKLLGGPQCGIVLGRKELVDRLKSHPLARAFRVGKLTIAALEATVRSYLDGTFCEDLPALAALHATREELRQRADRLAALVEEGDLHGIEVAVLEGISTVGGGSLPGSELPSWCVALAGVGVTDLESALRRGVPPVVARVGDGRVLLDVRTLRDEDLVSVAERVHEAAAGRVKKVVPDAISN